MRAGAEAMDEEGCIPRLAPGGAAASLALSPSEGFLLSRIDGRTDWRLLREIGGLPPEDAERCLARWVAEGIVVIERTPPTALEPAAGTPERPAPEIDEAAIDPDLDLSVELQREILETEASLDRPYHALLGVGREADARQIKRAYFKASKRYHPDRYFRRNVGGYLPRLDRIFKKIVEAYELLSDLSTRAEIERSLGPPTEAPSVSPDASGAERSGPPPAPPNREDSRRRALDRLRRQVRIPEKIRIERQFKAKELHQAALVSARREHWREAAASLKLAIAFDPWSDAYKGSFAEVQSRVNQLRAAELLQRAAASWDDEARQEALHLYEEAIAYSPRDAEANRGAARAALELGELDTAREYAENACELEPEVAEHRRTLARVLRKAGIRDKAAEALAAALRLDPDDDASRTELEHFRPNSRRKR